MDLFKEHMGKYNVRVAESVPNNVQQVGLRTESGKDLNGYVESWSPTLAKYKDQDVHYAITGGPNLSWESNEARHLAKCEEKYDICRPLFESLQYTQPIRQMSASIVDKLNAGGDWLAVHVHDFSAFLCHGDVDAEIRKVKERIEKNSLNPKTIYIVGGARDMQHISSVLGLDGVHVINKQSLLGADAEHLQFQESAAVDQGVVQEAASYLTKPGSSFDDLANNVRRMNKKEVATYELPQTWRGCESEEEAAQRRVELSDGRVKGCARRRNDDDERGRGRRRRQQ